MSSTYNAASARLPSLQLPSRHWQKWLSASISALLLAAIVYQLAHLNLRQLLSAIPFWRTSTMFDDEQRLVIEYADAVSIGDVSDELFARVVAVYGEQGTVEFTALVSWWAFWARILTTVRPSFKDAD